MILRDTDKITADDLIQLALETGFTTAGSLDMQALVFRQDVREMCAADKCRSYGRSWSCPPATGSLETVSARAAGYRRGIIVQTTGSMNSDFDYSSIQDTGKKHKHNFETLVRQLRMLYPDCLPMGAGACTICSRCSYPDRPCRHPKRMFPSMEAYGLLVSDVCRSSGIEYNYGPLTMTFTSCILID
jgi:predicted metal-binding protein